MSKPSEAAFKGGEKSFLSMPGFIADLFPGTGEQWVQFHRTYVACEADIIDAAADQKFKPLVEVAALDRNVIIEDELGFVGKWVAIPAEDFDALRQALQRVKGE